MASSQRRLRTGYGTAAVLIALSYACSGCGLHTDQLVSAAQSTNDGETIVLVRHGEIPANGLGQLSCTGLNRALALPGVLIGRFGRPDAIFAPDPADQIREGSSSLLYSYVRPLATIEPTAIQVGLPVNAQRSFQDIAGLQSDITAPQYANSTIFIAWEHAYAYLFAQQMLRSYGEDPSIVPVWSAGDFETMYVFHIASEPEGSAGVGQLTFQVQQEGLENSLSATCPN